MKLIILLSTLNIIFWINYMYYLYQLDKNLFWNGLILNILAVLLTLKIEKINTERIMNYYENLEKDLDRNNKNIKIIHNMNKINNNLIKDLKKESNKRKINNKEINHIIKKVKFTDNQIKYS